jgi:hypothetical protein
MKIDETLEMAYPQKLARDIIIDIADLINEHLVKLIAFQFDPQLRYHFRTELRSWLNKIQRIRLKPNARTGSFKFYFDHLFDYPFGGVEIHNTRALMEFISSEYDGVRPTISPEGDGQLVEGISYQARRGAAQRGSSARHGAGMSPSRGRRRSQPPGARLFSSRSGETPLR